MDMIDQLKEEPRQMRLMFKDLSHLADQDSPIPIFETSVKIDRLGNLWDKHEEKEERFFKNLQQLKINFPFERMVIEHREIRGHWRVIQKAIDSKDNNKLRIALDTDGRMFIEKLTKHMVYEEMHFDEIQPTKQHLNIN